MPVTQLSGGEWLKPGASRANSRGSANGSPRAGAPGFGHFPMKMQEFNAARLFARSRVELKNESAAHTASGVGVAGQLTEDHVRFPPRLTASKQADSGAASLRGRGQTKLS